MIEESREDIELAEYNANEGPVQKEEYTIGQVNTLKDFPEV